MPLIATATTATTAAEECFNGLSRQTQRHAAKKILTRNWSLQPPEKAGAFACFPIRLFIRPAVSQSGHEMEITAKQNFTICCEYKLENLLWKAKGGAGPDNVHLMRGHEPIRTLIVDYTNCLMARSLVQGLRSTVLGPLQGHKIFKLKSVSRRASTKNHKW